MEFFARIRVCWDGCAYGCEMYLCKSIRISYLRSDGAFQGCVSRRSRNSNPTQGHPCDLAFWRVVVLEPVTQFGVGSTPATGHKHPLLRRSPLELPGSRRSGGKAVKRARHGHDEDRASRPGRWSGPGVAVKGERQRVRAAGRDRLHIDAVAGLDGDGLGPSEMQAINYSNVTISLLV